MQHVSQCSPSGWQGQSQSRSGTVLVGISEVLVGGAIRVFAFLVRGASELRAFHVVPFTVYDCICSLPYRQPFRMIPFPDSG